MRPKKFLLIVKFLYQEIRVLLKNRIDYVFIPVSTNLNAVLKELIFISIALIFSKKVILIQHGNNFQKIRDTAPSIYDHIIHPILKRAHSGVVLAKNLKDNFRDILSEGKIVSIYPGIPTFRKYIEPIQDKRNNFRILFLSNLIPQKGYFDLIRAIPDVLQIYPGTMFIFAGEWKDDKVQTKEIVLKFIEDHQLNEVIIFAGKVDLPAKVDLYSDADIYVFPTHFDSFGLVLLEAMQFGLPIITTNVGAIPEIIIDGVNGIIVEKGHPERIAEEIIKLLKDPMLRQEMKKTNLAAFEAKFTTEKFSDRMVDFFDSLS
ncbi:MAG: glycosyltransferase family 4 protein [Bacteroidales bacterium]|nr:glycosyltransferase family 4 protein [Bacteroidales bacterium]